MSEPIWKDKIVTIGTTDALDYRVRIGNEVIYYGKSYLRPGVSSNSIKINEICEDYLESVLPTLTDAERTALGDVTFLVDAKSSTNWVNKASVKFRSDWSYDYGYDPSTMGMSFPASRKIDSRMWLTYTTEAESMVTLEVTDSEGGTIKVYKPLEFQADFNNDFNNDFSKSVKGNPLKTAVFNLAEFPDVASVKVNDTEYEVVTCGKYALYYLNAYGGWDSLLCLGTSKESDTVIRHTREIEYNNNVISNRGKSNYLNELEKNISLNTGWLSEEGSLRMHHLLNSTNVYLYDIVEGHFIPVVINATTTEHKTFKTQGGECLNYTIDVTIAHNMMRR